MGKMFANLKIGTRLIGLVIAMSVIIALVGNLGLTGMHHSDEGLERVYTDRVVPLRELKSVADTYAVNIMDTAH